MPTPRQGYRTADGKRAPGVTTVIGFRKECGGLMHWAWEQGRAGEDYRAKTQAAANLGTLVHAAIEEEVRGKPVTDPRAFFAPLGDDEQTARGVRSLEGFYRWRDAFRLELVDPEEQLVSERHRFGGTIDYAARLTEKRALIDLKTSKAVYDDHRIQVAAYWNLRDEAYPEDPVQEAHILQVGKNDGSFTHHYLPDLSAEWQAFLHLRAVYAILKEGHR